MVTFLHQEDCLFAFFRIKNKKVHKILLSFPCVCFFKAHFKKTDHLPSAIHLLIKMIKFVLLYL